MKKLIRAVLVYPPIARKLIRPILRLHNLAYQFSGTLSAVISEDGLHPKHQILKYKEWFLSHVKETDVILDIGSNTGELPRMLAEKARRVYGIEIVEALVNKAMSGGLPENVQLICGDATSFDYDSIDQVSVVTLSNVLEHIDDRVAFLNSITRHVRWVGQSKKILIRVPMMDRDWITMYKKNIGVEWRLDSTHSTEYTLESFLNEMDQVGISVDTYSVKYGELYAVCYSK